MMIMMTTTTVTVRWLNENDLFLSIIVQMFRFLFFSFLFVFFSSLNVSFDLLLGFFSAHLDKPMPIWIDVYFYFDHLLSLFCFISVHYHSLFFARTISLSFACKLTSFACLVVAQYNEDMTANRNIAFSVET